MIQWQGHSNSLSRDDVFSMMRSKGIGVNVHYQPIYQHPFYMQMLAADPAMAMPDCPVADMVYQNILSLPIFPLMKNSEVESVVSELKGLAQSTTVRRVAA